MFDRFCPAVFGALVFGFPLLLTRRWCIVELLLLLSGTFVLYQCLAEKNRLLDECDFCHVRLDVHGLCFFQKLVPLPFCLPLRSLLVDLVLPRLATLFLKCTVFALLLAELV